MVLIFIVVFEILRYALHDRIMQSFYFDTLNIYI